MVREAIACVACQGRFFASSLPFHQKSCFKRNGFVETNCPKCQQRLLTHQYHDHLMVCEVVNVCKEYKVAQDASDRQICQKAQPAEDQDQDNNPNNSQIGEDDNQPRLHCEKCQRGFHPDRIAKHQAVCHGKKYEPKKPFAIEATPTNQREISHNTPSGSSASLGLTCSLEQHGFGDKQAIAHHGKSHTKKATTNKPFPAVDGSQNHRSLNPAVPASSFAKAALPPKLFDAVHRGWSSQSTNISLSNATSQSNPLASGSMIVRQRQQTDNRIQQHRI